MFERVESVFQNRLSIEQFVHEIATALLPSANCFAELLKVEAHLWRGGDDLSTITLDCNIHPASKCPSELAYRFAIFISYRFWDVVSELIRSNLPSTIASHWLFPLNCKVFDSLTEVKLKMRNSCGQGSQVRKSQKEGSMITKPQKSVPTSPFSMRINPETRALLDYLIERTGLKDAQLFRMGVKLLVEKERSLAAVAPTPARKTR